MITVEDMRDKLINFDAAREILAQTEPLAAVDFTVGRTVRFAFDSGWQHGLEAKSDTTPVNAAIVLGLSGHPDDQESYQLTKGAVLEAAAVCGLPKTYAARLPNDLIQSQFNHWYQGALMDRGRSARYRDFRLITANGVGAAFTRGTALPVSNLRLLDQILDGVQARYGPQEILVDYKFTHSLRSTRLRLILPEQQRVIAGSSTDNDVWSVGVQLDASLIGEHPTSIDGYLFRWWCTNGAIDTVGSEGAWSRRAGASDTEVFEWARHAVDGVLGGLEPALDAVEALTQIPIEGRVTDVLRDIFEHYRISVQDRTRITENLVNIGATSMYDLMQAVTQAANDLSDEVGRVDNLLRVGGDLPHSTAGRCDGCSRLMPH